MREAHVKAIADSIRKQAGNLADFVETNPARTQKDDLYTNIFLAFTGIMGAILYLDITIYDFYDIMRQLFQEDTVWKILAKLEEWDDNYARREKLEEWDDNYARREKKDINIPNKEEA